MKSRNEFETDADYTTYLRTHFAAMAMQGITTAWSDLNSPWLPKDSEVLTKRAVQIADALIEALNQEVTE